MRDVAFARWDPLRDLLTLHEQLSHLVGQDPPGWTPAVDLYETTATFVLIAELPGMERGRIDIHAEESRITIRGERQAGLPGRHDADVRCEQYHRVERGHGRFSRTFVLPESIDVEAIRADLKEGLLTVTMPKAAQRGARHIEVS